MKNRMHALDKAKSGFDLARSQTEQGNPIFCDSLRGQNGGFYKTEDGLFRINQIQGKDHYGKAFAQNKVIQLDCEGYKEELVGVVNANFFPDITPTHHFHQNNGYCVIDFARNQNLYNILKEEEKHVEATSWLRPKIHRRLAPCGRIEIRSC